VFCNGLSSVYGGHVESRSSTAWFASGLAALIGLAVVGLVYLVSAENRFQRGRLHSAVAQTRDAQSRRRSAALDRRCCERLLGDMLPPGVADRLKAGQTVEPETFDIASVYFSDIVGFNDFAVSCHSPLVIVRLLNSVFR